MKAQTVGDELRQDVRRAAGLNYELPVAQQYTDTPAPAGKRAFYINHYGCPAAFYPEQTDRYRLPYATLAKADSAGALTPFGRDVLQRLAVIKSDAEGRSGELTDGGKQHIRALMRQLTERYPSVFTDGSYIDGRSIVRNHCIQTMDEALLQVSLAHQNMKMRPKASHKNDPWMAPVDNTLKDRRTDSLTMAAYNAFVDKNSDDSRLTALLFSDADYAKTVDSKALATQLFYLAGVTANTPLTSSVTLFDLFTPEEIQRHWRCQNAWNYVNFGACKLNGGQQPYVQREILWNMLHMGDSIISLNTPVAHLRYTHQAVLMSLACLMELDNCGFATDSLDLLEDNGWADYRMTPFGGSIAVIHYRIDKDDNDILIKVLLNGHEARMPIKTDCAPYYHWQDVKRYYLRKLYRYQRQRYE